MAFVPTTSFIPRWNLTCFKSDITKCLRGNDVNVRSSKNSRRVSVINMKCEEMEIKDGMDFFRHREGKWSSWRVTHHLAFRRSESGESNITMQCLDSTDSRIIDLCKQWEVDPKLSQGGCFVTWEATLDWDQEGENHQGDTIFALVPDENDIRKGRMLRDRGYAEIVPIAGTYYLDEEDDLNLETPYEGGAVIEKFSFDGPDIVNRLSTVKRFGGFSTATFATENRRVENEENEEEDDDDDFSEEEIIDMLDNSFLNTLARETGERVREVDTITTQTIRTSRWGAPLGEKNDNDNQPSAGSAFSSGFATSQRNSDNSTATETTTSTEEEVEDILSSVERLAKKAGVDLSKIPPSMRADFLETFKSEEEKK